MILFVAPNPNNISEKEGFLQRVAAIDGMFPREKKLYYDDFTDLSKLAAQAIKADMIYVHSLYFAEKILQVFPLLGFKIVVDLHGVVPEEEAYSGHQQRSDELAAAEKMVFEHCVNFVAVSHSMAEYYKKKYKQARQANWIILPIFNVNKSDMKSKRVTKNVIYAGGAQKWQNVELMAKTINEMPEYNYTILTHNPEAFKEKLSDEAMDRIVLKSVASTKVPYYYKKSSLGFILRDDITVNNVACPTKLIEYLGEGVVPIVHSPRIGDFERLGYMYFTADEFARGKASPERIREAMKQNLIVFDALKDQTRSGTGALKAAYGVIRAEHDTVDDEMTRRYVEAALVAAQYQAEVRHHKEHVEHLEGVVREYAKSVDYYKNLYEATMRSRSRAFLNGLRLSWQVMERRGKKNS